MGLVPSIGGGKVIHNHGEIPTHWIGVRKWWEDSCRTFAEALVSVPPSLLTTHTYGIGSSGMGKSTVLQHFMAQDILEGHSMIILDMRGDGVQAALELCAGRVPAEKILLYDLREKVNPTGFSPTSGSGPFYFRALNFLEAVRNENDLGVQVSEDLMNGCLLCSATNTPITKLEQIFVDDAFRAGLLAKCSEETVIRFWTRFDSLSGQVKASRATAVLNKVSILFCSEGLRRMLGHQSPADLGKHLNTPGSVTLISLAVDELHGASRMMGSIFLSAICQEIFARVTIPENDRVPIRLYVDEFENFAMDFEPILAEGRRLKFSLFCAHQTLAQVSPKVRSIILGNVGVKLIFRVGRDDAETLSKDLTGNSRALDLANLPRGEAILWRRDHPLIQVEINAPLLTNPGVPSPEYKLLQAQIKELTPPYQPDSDQLEVPKPHRHDSGNQSSNLADWL